MEPTYYGGELPEITVYGNKYIKEAKLERARQRGIAKSYLKEGPSIDNLYNAVSALWKSLPINTNYTTINPHTVMGEVPAAGRKLPITPKMVSKFESAVYPRMFKGMPGERYQKAITAAREGMPKEYLEYDTKIPGHPYADGTWNPNNHTISLVKGKENAFGHEYRHAADDNFKLSQQERSLLKDAYDDTFLEYGDSPSIVTERVTTNYDIRDVLLSEAGLSHAPLNIQNEYLQSVNAKQLYNAMSKANDYSRAYLARMLKSPKYTDNNYSGYTKILRNIKNAMQIVPSISLPLWFTDPQQAYKEYFNK